MKYRIALAVAALAKAAHKVADIIERVGYGAASLAMTNAWEHGLAAEQTVVNKAKADLMVARERLEQASKAAQAALKSHPDRVEAVRAKVFG